MFLFSSLSIVLSLCNMFCMRYFLIQELTVGSGWGGYLVRSHLSCKAVFLLYILALKNVGRSRRLKNGAFNKHSKELKV